MQKQTNNNQEYQAQQESVNRYILLSNTSNETFYPLPLDLVLSKVKNRTVIDVGDADVLIQDILCCNLHVPKVILPKRRVSIYKAMVHCLVYNNSDLSLAYVLSFIYHVNKRFTKGNPMPIADMVKTVTSVYEDIKETGEIRVFQKRRYHTNPKYDRKTRIRLAAQARGKEQQERSILLIQSAVTQLVSKGEKPTALKVKAILEKPLHLSTIKRHWRKVVPKNLQ
jgi:hypothetical protein